MSVGASRSAELLPSVRTTPVSELVTPPSVLASPRGVDSSPTTEIPQPEASKTLHQIPALMTLNVRENQAFGDAINFLDTIQNRKFE